MGLASISHKLGSISMRRESETNRRNSLNDELSVLLNKLNLYSDAIKLCSRCLQEQADVRSYIEAQVTILLRLVVGVEYEFKYEPIYREDGISLKGLKPVILKNGIPDDPRNYGEGVQNVISLAHRIILLIFSKKREKVLILDEPLLNLNERKWPYVIEFIINLQKFFKIQIIVITHVQTRFPETYKVTMSGKTSVVERIADTQ